MAAAGHSNPPNFSAQRAEDEGWNRVVIGVDEEGRLDREQLLCEIDSSCAFVSMEQQIQKISATSIKRKNNRESFLKKGFNKILYNW